MSQQLQQPPTAQQSVQPTEQQAYQPQYQAQTPAGQQFQQSQFGQQLAQGYQQSVSMEVQQAVNDLEKVESLFEWTKSRAVQRGMPRVAARCDDLAEIAHLEKGLLIRDSPFAEPIGRATEQTIQQGIQELQHRAGDPEVQEALSQAQQSLHSTSQALQRVQSLGQQGVAQQQIQY